ncbi:hypothetical protein INT47_005869 [Mucor saturninus]|uniref:Uncharacterized protein n=1 Tax=Mucor saturninus TaxID=64648 RepID=A0A8H7QIG8_9FUNG|nr:hypothetical protein INT47_005869 [Mucor saturninus]
MQNYAEESRLLVIDLNARMRDMVRETVEKLVMAENISGAEADDAIDFICNLTEIHFGKRKSPYNAFTEKFAATKKTNATAGVQSKEHCLSLKNEMGSELTAFLH